MNELNVKKRNGNICGFEMNKIMTAIKKAMDSCGMAYTEAVLSTLALKVVADFQGNVHQDIIDIESIQDSVERVLQDNGFHEVGKAYILYRKQHERARNMEETMFMIYPC